MTSTRDCLLCRVARGELQADRIIETEKIIGIMNDIEPVSRGHCVFFPRTHAAKLHDADDGDLSEMLPLIKKVARAMGVENYNILQNNGSLANQTVFHVHVHLIPKWSDAEGLKWSRDLPKHIDQREISQDIREKLSG